MQYSRQSYAGMSLYHSIANVTKDMGLHQLLLNLHSVRNCEKNPYMYVIKMYFLQANTIMNGISGSLCILGFGFNLIIITMALKALKQWCFILTFVTILSFFHRPLIYNFSSFLHQIKNNAQKNQWNYCLKSGDFDLTASFLIFNINTKN